VVTNALAALKRGVNVDTCGPTSPAHKIMHTSASRGRAEFSHHNNVDPGEMNVPLPADTNSQVSL